MKTGPLLRGLATFVPGVVWLHKKLTRTGGTDSAAYCYGVWMRHLLGGHQNGLCGEMPQRVAELGPGDSIGVGIAALLSGVETYYGLDALPLADSARNLTVFDGLVDLFRRKTPVPDAVGSRFPEDFIRFDERRVAQIRASIVNPAADGSLIRYIAPWWASDRVERGSIDMIFSHAVLEHVEDLPHTYSTIREWLAPGGWISHQIDFRCHGTADEWHGHWTMPEWYWRLVRGRRSFFLNRQPHSYHVKLMQETGFVVVVDERAAAPGASRQRLAKQFRHFTDTDLTTEGAFIQAHLAHD